MQQGTVEAGPTTTIVLQPCTVATVIFETANRRGGAVPARLDPGGRKVVHFRATAETGDVTEFNGDRGGGVWYCDASGRPLEDVFSRNTKGVQASTDVAHSGTHSFRCWLEDPATAHHAKLMRGRIDRKEAYYSAWYYFDANFKTDSAGGSVNIMQWKTTPDATGGNCDPTFVILCGTHPDDVRRISLFHWPVALNKLPFKEPVVEKGVMLGRGAAYLQSSPRPIPDQTWVHIEAYYRSDREDGQVVVWQDGTEVINVRGVNTQDSASPSSRPCTIFGVGNYPSTKARKNLKLYVDDVMVTNYRVSAVADEREPAPEK
jgi:hypothetical protein